MNADGSQLQPFADGDHRIPYEVKSGGLQPFSVRTGQASS
jgi:hypothetical protein